MNSNAYLTYGLNQEGQLVHVDSVPNGNECGCFCPHCKSKLCAKNGGDGKKMIHHFAHLSGADCVGAVESALHKMAKDILLESKCVFLPERPDGRMGELLQFDRVEVEFFDKDTGLRPDCVGYYGDKFLWVEFKRTHAVDTDKKAKIISSHIDCIEIDLNCCTLNPNSLKNFIINSSEGRIWIRDTSSKIRIAGGLHARGASYCDRFDYYHEGLSLSPTFTRDENGHLIDCREDDLNVNQHRYFCLGCGNELTIDVDKYGTYRFVHIDKSAKCDFSTYLREAAKEIVYDKFNRSREYEIAIPQYQNCVEKDSCQLYNDNKCCKEGEFSHDIKYQGYNTCLKDFLFPNGIIKCDLVFKRSDSFNDAIIVFFDTEDNLCAETNSLNNRIIKVMIYDGYGLDTLKFGRLDTTFATFKHFRKHTTGFVSKSDVNRTILKFELFSSGKYFLNEINCFQADQKKHSTVYELIFKEDLNDFIEAKAYALYKCYKANRKCCFCELCFFIERVDNFGLSDVICKRYKTKGTPHYPLQVMPTNCPHFSLNQSLVSRLEKEYSDIKIIEKNKENGD